jgi:hypothetical protein
MGVIIPAAPPPGFSDLEWSRRTVKM